jgi:uncharacterized SAM-binding protein YcdF (DUF218 family)
MIIGYFFNLLNLKFLSTFLYIISLLAFIISAVMPTGSYLNYLLEKNYHSINYLPAKIDGILILSGATNPYLTKEHNQISLNGSVERLTESIILVKKYPDAKIIFSGGSGSLKYPDLNHTLVAKKFFNTMGINSNKIYYDNKSRNTYENILFAKKIANPKKNEKWLLVTSASHFSRSLGVAEKLEWKLIPYAVDFNKPKKFSWKFSIDLLSNLSEFEKASHEWIGLIAYYLMGRTAKMF